MYQQLMGINTTLVSVGHRSTILKFHKQVLELKGNGQWQAHKAKLNAMSTARKRMTTSSGRSGRTRRRH
ncbi:hypothetical protein [Aquabacterium sp. NJ1]|uniref:hypothetical protein n=1 Tax=Aquabacterium sp. NJ1 TaxID=1538295 RepID=UPI00126A5BD9|nr:hypothetical protein [Aquabacterium sp. NJ1]